MSEDIDISYAGEITSRRDLMPAFIAIGALAIGVLVYVFDRAPENTYFLPAGWALTDGGYHWFGAIGGQLPEFVHVYAFALLTAAVFGFARWPALMSCVAWFTVNSLFELGQHPAVSTTIVAALPAWFDGIPFLENTGPYFMYGTFDLLDLVAIAAGAVAAYCTITIARIHQEGRRYAKSS